MCKRKVEGICSTITFLLGGLFGFGVSYFHGKEHFELHVIGLIVIAAIGFHVTQLTQEIRTGRH